MAAQYLARINDTNPSLRTAEPLLSVQAVRASLDAAAASIKSANIDPFDVLGSEQSNEQASLLEDAAVKVCLLLDERGGGKLNR